MADEPGEVPNAGDGEVLELQADQIVDPGDGGEGEPGPAEGGDGEEVVVSFGDEAAPASDSEAPEWVRDLRKRNRELERKVSELEKGKGPEIPEVGEKPTLEDCDYDEERYERELNSYLDRKSKAEAAKSEAQKAEDARQEQYQAKVTAYGEQKTKLGVKDFDQAEEVVLASLSPAQQAILIHGAENKATLVYALGKHPEKLRQLAAIKDPIEFAFAAAKLEGQTKMTRRPATSPESTVAGSGSLSGQGGKLSDKLSADEWRRRRNEQVRNR